tara:strand:- start:727 stop:960 length:234 start_codon:yes stop_codon:yes gene_type:complete
MKTVSKSELKARMLEYFREVEKTGEPLVVTDHRKPVLQVTPLARQEPVAEVFADLRGQLNATEAAVLAPTTDEWNLK